VCRTLVVAAPVRREFRATGPVPAHGHASGQMTTLRPLRLICLFLLIHVRTLWLLNYSLKKNTHYPYQLAAAAAWSRDAGGSTCQDGADPNSGWPLYGSGYPAKGQWRRHQILPSAVVWVVQGCCPYQSVSSHETFTRH
jgi:hypothetical protein